MYFSRAGIFSLFFLIGVLLLLFSGQLVDSLVQAVRVTAPPSKPALSPTNVSSPQAGGTAVTSLIVPGRENAPPLQLKQGQYVVYEQNNALYLVSSAGGSGRIIPTTGFINSRATPPILTPGGQILYSGDGVWMTDIFGGAPRQIAELDAGQAITSMALSSDGKMLAWSSEPIDGSGIVVIHAGPLADASIVLTRPTSDCPCFHIFSFMHGPSAQADNILLLTDDRGSSGEVQYGLWSLDLTKTHPTAQLIMDGNSQQGPLAMAPLGNTLLYSTSEGAVPIPSDLDIPSNLLALSYANSLSAGVLNGSPPALSTGQVILPEQDNLSNSAQYHWVTTPVFSPDGRTLAYVVFSNDGQPPYERYSAIYTVSVSGSGSHLSAGKPKLLATSSNQLVELGPWLNGHILSIYADGALYALDIQSGSVALFARPNGYAYIVAAIGSG